MAALATVHGDGKHQGDGDVFTAPALSSLNVKERLSQSKVTEFLREAGRIRRQIDKLEQERTVQAQCKKNGWIDWFRELAEYERVLQESRDAEKMTIKKQLMKIRNGVRMFQRQLTDVKPTPLLIEKLHGIMTEVEGLLNTFKEDQCLRFEELMKEEIICCQEITAYEKKIDNYTLAVNTEPKQHPGTAYKLTKQSAHHLPPEVKAVDAFLQSAGGAYGGWDQYDHQAFLKVWTKYSGQLAYRKEVLLYLPGKSPDEILQHEAWYQELLFLQDKKREAIQRWKASRHRERQDRVQDQEEMDEAERKEREARIQAQQHRAEKEKREALRQLEEWKELKRREEEQEEAQRLAEEIQQRRRAKEERRRQLEVKLTVEEQLRLKKEAEREKERMRQEKEEREMEERKREAAMGIKCFQERDLHKVETKLQEKQLREQNEVERQRRIASKIKEKVEGHITRDPSRLSQPTKGWEERMKHIGSSGGGPVLHMYHRAIPSWRQGL